MLGDRFSYSYFPFNRRSENRAQVTYRASLGKPIVSIVVLERCSLVNLSTSLYMEEGTSLLCRKTLIHINKGNPLFARESKGNPPTGLIFDPSLLLT